MTAATTIRIGTRASQLARWQTNWVADRMRERGARVELVEIRTSGDREQLASVSSLGVQGVFTKELQAALLAGQIDAAVHSLKDMPTEPVQGFTLAAVPERAEPFDALVTCTGAQLADLAAGARIGTGSPRRVAQLRYLRSDVEVVGIRGNVDTRLRKLDEGEFDAIVLAAAGLIRLGLGERITEVLKPPRMLPAPGQGALAIECRAGEETVLTVFANLDHAESHSAVRAERTLLAELRGGCSAPVGAWGRIEEGELVLDGLVASVDGRRVLRHQERAPTGAAVQLGKQVAAALLDQGAQELIASARG